MAKDDLFNLTVEYGAFAQVLRAAHCVKFPGVPSSGGQQAGTGMLTGMEILRGAPYEVFPEITAPLAMAWHRSGPDFF
jgi:hypothetical protein